MYALTLLLLGFALVTSAFFLSRKMLREERELDKKVRETLNHEETSFIVSKMICLRKRSNLSEKRDRARYNLLKAQLKERVSDEEVLRVLHTVVENVVGFYDEGRRHRR